MDDALHSTGFLMNGDFLVFRLADDDRQAGPVDADGDFLFSGRDDQLSIEAGIEHQAMRRILSGPQRIDTREAAIESAIRAIDSARRRVWIRSFDLESWLYADADVLLALRRFATSGRGNEVRVFAIALASLCSRDKK